MKIRLDNRVAGQLGISRSKAVALIMAGQVRRGSERLSKPGLLVGSEEPLEINDTANPVSRAAGKLSPAFTRWQWDVNGQTILDVGSSTGGFTELLLAQGAAKVIAVDVGRGQLAWALRQDPRVISLEETDIRDLAKLPEPAQGAVADVSFISLRRVLPSIAGLLPPTSPVMALFKPQFEVGKVAADKHRGVITDRQLVEETLQDFREWLSGEKWQVKELTPSPVKGTRGNQEYLCWLESPDGR